MCVCFGVASHLIQCGCMCILSPGSKLDCKRFFFLDNFTFYVIPIINFKTLLCQAKKFEVLRRTISSTLTTTRCFSFFSQIIYVGDNKSIMSFIMGTRMHFSFSIYQTKIKNREPVNLIVRGQNLYWELLSILAPTPCTLAVHAISLPFPFRVLL